MNTRRMAKVLLLLSLLFLLVLIGAMSTWAEGDDGLFPDPALERAVRRAIDRPSGVITPDDVRGIDTLHASGEVITEVRGFEHLASLSLL